MIDPRPELVDALERLHAGARFEPLPGDASTRRFLRLHLAEGGTRIVMDYGAPFDGETDDVRLGRVFERAGLPVARIFDVLPEAGCLLLEDLGDMTFESALERSEGAKGPSRQALYARGIELAADVAARGTRALTQSPRAGGPALDAERFRFEMGFFAEHFVGGYLGRTAGASLVRELEQLADLVAGHPRVMCHRDFHSRNLMVRGDGTLAMVDIQDARWGPDTYDVASLLRDAYVEIDEGEIERGLRTFGASLEGQVDLAALAGRFHLVATQRMIKALGTFGYQVARLARTRYESAIPRTLGRLKASLPTHPETAPIDAALRASGIYD